MNSLIGIISLLVIIIGIKNLVQLHFNIKESKIQLNTERRNLAVLKSRNINSNFYVEHRGTRDNPDLKWYISLINGRLYGTWSDEPSIYYFDPETIRWVLDETIIH